MSENTRSLLNFSSLDIYVKAGNPPELNFLYDSMIELLERKPTVRNQAMVRDLLKLHRETLERAWIRRTGSGFLPKPRQIKLDTAWPTTTIIRSNLSKIKNPIDGIWQHKHSALFLCGYRVGKTKGLKPALRRNLLDKFFLSALNPLIEQYYGGDYGNARSMTRLLKMAKVIAGNCRNFKRQSHTTTFHNAISDYEDDLSYLKENYFLDLRKREKSQEQWPKTNV